MNFPLVTYLTLKELSEVEKMEKEKKFFLLVPIVLI
jgi:hypothetical protein